MALQDQFELKCVCSGLNDQLNLITRSTRLAVEQLNECQTVGTWTLCPLRPVSVEWVPARAKNAFSARSQAFF